MDGGQAPELQILPVVLLSLVSEVYHSSGWPHIHVYMGTTDWTLWAIKKIKRDMKLGAVMERMGNKYD